MDRADAVRGTGGRRDARLRRRSRARRGLKRVRAAVAIALGPVVAAGTSLVPATAVTAGVTAGVAAAAVAAAPAAKASTAGSVLILSSSVNGGTSSAEAAAATADGYTPVIEPASTWDGLTTQSKFTSAFSGYAAVIIGDPSAGTTCSSTANADALSNKADWGPAITGNVAVLGTAPALAGPAGTALLRDAIASAASGPSGTTGLYISLNCDYSGSSYVNADASLLDGLAGGGFTVTGQVSGSGPSCSDSGTVNTWEAGSSSSFGGLAGSALAASAWGATACPVQETFGTWPGNFTPVAYDAAATPATFTASDGALGQAYALLGIPAASAATLALAPSTGGEVPAGATTGGLNPAASGVSAGFAGDPVNTENGDFSQSATDLSIPAFGPSLEFSRTYDALAAQQQEETGTPGPLGFGWTDNWASSLTAAAPIPGNIYALDGLAGAASTGEGLTQYAANGQAPASAPLGHPGYVLVSGGNTYYSDTQGNRVEEIPGSTGTQWGSIAMTAGKTYTIAGSYTGQSGNAGDGGQATAALLTAPAGLALDSAGNLYIADSGDNNIRKVSTTGVISRFAGNSTSGTGADGVAASSSSLAGPAGVTVDSAGNVYIADAGNNRIQEVAKATGSQWGQPMTAGDIYTMAGSAAGTSGDTGSGTSNSNSRLSDPQGITVNANGVYVADTSNCKVVLFSANSGTYWGISMSAGNEYRMAGQNHSTCGTPANGTVGPSADLDYPDGITVGPNGGLYIADTGASQIAEVASGGRTEFGVTMTSHDIYNIAGNGTAGNTGDGGAAISAELNRPAATAVDPAGNLWIADASNNQLREVSASTADIAVAAGDGQTMASAGNGGPAVNGMLVRPGGEIADSHGDLYIADTGNNRVQEIAAYTHAQWGIAMTGGEVYTIAGYAGGAAGNSGDGGPATSAALYDPEGLAFDAAGDLLIVDQGNNQVREVNAATGTISTIAGSTAGTGGTSGDGGPATSGLLNRPFGIAVDGKGDIYIADKDNNRIQEIQASGGYSWGQTMAAGDVYTVAGSSAGTSGDSGDGGAATSAKLTGPEGITTDAAGNLYIADTSDQQVREVPVGSGTQHGQSMTKNDIYTIAGSTAGTAGSSGTGGRATGSLLHTPVGLATDPAGDVYIADGDNNRVQEIPGANGTQWATPMTAGDIYTIAGKPGTASDTGNGGPAAMATIYFAVSNNTDAYGDLYIGDWSGGQLREITSATPATIAPAPGLTSALYPAPGSTINGTTYPAGITVTQPGGAQVTFYPKTGGSCAAPQQPAGGYCVMPLYSGAALTANGTTSYTFTPSPASDTYTYAWSGQLTAQTDTAGSTLTIAYQTPAPGTAVPGYPSQLCPASVHTCDTITAASGRALVIGLSSSGLVATVTDPMGRQWAYGYNSASDLTSATDPLGNVTTYGYDTGNSGPLLAADLLTITSPDAQPGYNGPDADPGSATVNVYDTLGRVASQTDPMGNTTTFSYCPDQAAGDCMNATTGTGYVTVTDPDGNATVYDYLEGTLAGQSDWTGATSPSLTSENDSYPDTTITSTPPAYCATGDTGGTDGSLLDTASVDGDRNQTSYCYDASGDQTAAIAPSGGSTPTGTATTSASYTSTSEGDQQNCDGKATASTTGNCDQGAAGPAPVSPGGIITPPASAPPLGLSWTLYDTDGNELYTTTGVYDPGSSSAAYSQTSYQLFNGNKVTLPNTSTQISCSNTAPSISLPCATISADGLVTQLQYDAQGDLTQSSAPDGNPGNELATTSYSYDSDGEQLTTVTPDGNITGGNAGNYTTTNAWNADGQQTSITQGNGTGHTGSPRATSYSYDADGNKTITQDGRGYTTTTTYNADNKPTLVENPDNDSTLTCYDGDGNNFETVPAAGVDAQGLSASSCPTSFPADYNPTTKAPLASDATMYAYNADGEQTAAYTPAPAGQTGYETTTYAYDGTGNLLTTTAPPASNGGASQVTADTYNTAEQLTTQTAGYGTSAASTVSYCYDPNGDKTSVVYADGNTTGTATCSTTSPWTVTATSQANYQTTYTYDSAGEPVSTTTPKTTAAPSGATTTSTYDPAGNALTRTDPDGVTTTWTYTPLNLTASASYSGSSAHSVTYSYDASGNKTGMTDATGTSANVYDQFGELTSAQNGAGQTTQYGYNADGQISSITYPLPSTATWATTKAVTYGYDNADQLTSVTDFNGHQIATGNTADGLPKSETLGSSGDTIATTYDNTDSPSAITLKNSTSTLQSFTYSDSPAGTILSETDTPTSSQAPAVYTYDAQGRVTSMTPGSGSKLNYGFDASGDPTLMPTGGTGTYDNAGELTTQSQSGSTTSYTYNADGQQLAATQGAATVSQGTWNGAGQLTAYSNAAANMTATTYEGNGLRASTTITPSGQSAVTQGYIWDTIPGVPQLLMDGISAYIYDGGQAPAEQVSLSNGTGTYLVADSLGSVRGTVNSTGALTATAGYDAWGNPETAGGLTAVTPFGYAGGYTDPDGLIYLINRYYEPSTGEFTSVDPEIAQTLQPYAYADDNPTNASDPSGNETNTVATPLYFKGSQLCIGNNCLPGVPKGEFDMTIFHNGREVHRLSGHFQLDPGVHIDNWFIRFAFFQVKGSGKPQWYRNITGPLHHHGWNSGRFIWPGALKRAYYRARYGFVDGQLFSNGSEAAYVRYSF